MNDLISRQAAISHVDDVPYIKEHPNVGLLWKAWLESLPSAQPEIIRCNSCKYWTQSTGRMKGYGLGRCDFHDADLVTCNGFCYWAERRIDDH